MIHTRPLFSFQRRRAFCFLTNTSRVRQGFRASAFSAPVKEQVRWCCVCRLLSGCSWMTNPDRLYRTVTPLVSWWISLVRFDLWLAVILCVWFSAKSNMKCHFHVCFVVLFIKLWLSMYFSSYLCPLSAKDQGFHSSQANSKRPVTTGSKVTLYEEVWSIKLH